jgi:hypothetical protein
MIVANGKEFVVETICDRCQSTYTTYNADGCPVCGYGSPNEICPECNTPYTEFGCNCVERCPGGCGGAIDDCICGEMQRLELESELLGIC